jgi:hypothetical protein
MDLIGAEEMTSIYRDRSLRSELMLSYAKEENAAGQYAMPEQAALQFYLQYVLRDRHKRLIFDVHAMRLEELGYLADELHEYQQLQSRAPRTAARTFMQHLDQYPRQ